MSRTRRTRARIMRNTRDDRFLRRLSKAIRRFGWDGAWAKAYAGSAWQIASVVTERPERGPVQ